MAKRGILDKKTQKVRIQIQLVTFMLFTLFRFDQQLNRLNVSLFTPALLFSKVAFSLTRGEFLQGPYLLIRVPSGRYTSLRAFLRFPFHVGRMGGCRRGMGMLSKTCASSTFLMLGHLGEVSPPGPLLEGLAKRQSGSFSNEVLSCLGLVNRSRFVPRLIV